MAGPWQVSGLEGGTNNSIWQVKTRDKQKYVLRIVPDITSAAYLRYEACLLQELAHEQPPFALPIPLKTYTGDTLVQFAQETGNTALAILTPLLAGHRPDSHPERSNPLIAIHAAKTLAWLDRALARIPQIEQNQAQRARTTFGNLAAWHPLVPDPLASIDKLPLDQEQGRYIKQLVARVLDQAPNLYSHLPQQLLHRDYDPSNILVEGQQVAAILDFEFAAEDLRALDLSIALSWWPAEQWGSGKEWELLDIFGTSYQSIQALTDEELEALPTIWRLHEMTSLINRIGRYLAGQETDMRIRDRIHRSVQREEWMAKNQRKLIAHAEKWRDISKQENVDQISED